MDSAAPDDVIAGGSASPVPPSRVVAVVVTFNGAAWIADCIASLQRSNCQVQVVVVDNASTDGTVAICRACAGVQVICNATNLGFGAANNQGIALALQQGARYVLLANQDIVVQPGMLPQLVAQLECDPAAGIAAPLQLNASGTSVDAIFLKHYLAESGGTFLSDAVLRSAGGAYAVESAPAAVWLCSAAMLRTVGGFNPLFFMYCEDDDLCRRLRHHGFKLILVPGARFNHARGFYAGAALAPWRARLRRRYIRAHSAFILSAIDPKGKAVVQMWRASVTSVLGGLREFLCHADLISMASSMGAVGAGLLRWRKISAARRLVVQPGPHWLAGCN
jgi:GT2 family glycosyltransferase